MSKKPIDPEDSDVWNEATKTIKPLKKSSKKTLHHEPPSQKKIKVESKIRVNDEPRSYKASSPIDVGKTTQMDHRTAQKFKRGDMRPEATLDLHGMTLSEASQKLERFVLRAAEMGKRSLLIITGRGQRRTESFEPRATIREQVPVWLSVPHLSGYILAITQAEPKDGGAGAYYVLLRRER